MQMSEEEDRRTKFREDESGRRGQGKVTTRWVERTPWDENKSGADSA